MNKRPIPEPAIEDPNSVEMLTVWIAGHSLHCSIKVGMYTAMGMDEVSAWGRILADSTRHIANALAEKEGRDSSETVAGIFDAIDKELAVPTSDARGKFVKKN